MIEFKNRWQEIMDTPAGDFRSVPFMELIRRASSWDNEVPGVVMRIENSKSGKVTEKLYRRPGSASNACMKAEAAGHVVTLYDSEQMYCSTGIECIDDEE